MIKKIDMNNYLSVEDWSRMIERKINLLIDAINRFEVLEENRGRNLK